MTKKTVPLQWECFIDGCNYDHLNKPDGHRVEDLVEWAHEIIKRYEGTEL